MQNSLPLKRHRLGNFQHFDPQTEPIQERKAEYLSSQSADFVMHLHFFNQMSKVWNYNRGQCHFS